MSCKYIILLPGGEEFELPTTFSKITSPDTLKDLFKSYKNLEYKLSKDTENEKFQTEFESVKEEFVIAVSKLIPKIKAKEALSLIDSSQRLDDLHKKINDTLEDSGELLGIRTALLKYVKDNSKYVKGKNIAITSLLKKLKVVRNKDYFTKQSVAGIIGATTIDKEYNRVKDLNTLNELQGFTTLVSSNLKSFLKAIKNKDTTSNVETLFGFNSESMSRGWAIDNEVIMYKNEDDLALFQALFKKYAFKIDQSSLLNILGELDKKLTAKNFTTLVNTLIKDRTVDIKEFFNGDPEKNKPSMFEWLLDNSEKFKIQKEITQIISLVALSLQHDTNVDLENIKVKQLTKVIQSLFWTTSPNSYGHNNIEKMLADEAMQKEEFNYGKILQLENIDFEKALINTNNNYYPRKRIKGQDLLNNVRLYKDLVLFDTKKNGNDITVYGIVTEIHHRSNGYYVIGTHINKDGEIRYFNQVFTNNESVVIRKLGDDFIRQEYIEINVPSVTNKNSALITGTPIPSRIIQNYIQKGDIIETKGSKESVVVGIYPGEIWVKLPGTSVPYKLKYENIYTFKSAKFFKEAKALEDVNKPINLNGTIAVNGDSLTTDDYFSLEESSNNTKTGDPTSVLPKLYNGKIFFNKKVVYKEDDRIYYYTISEKNNYVLKSVLASLISNGRRNSYGAFIKKENDEIIKNVSFTENASSSRATMSSFSNINKAVEGDYFYYRDNNQIITGKVVEDNKIIIGLDDRSIQTLEDIKSKNPIFLTKRAINSKHFFYTERVNSNYTQFKGEGDYIDPLDQPMFYVINKDILEEYAKNPDVIQPRELLNKLSVGRYISDLKFMDSTEENATELLSLMLNHPDKQPVFKKIKPNSKKWEPNLTSLHNIINFSTLSSKLKKEMNPIKSGRYIRLYKNSILEYDIYRIESVDKETEKVTLHINKRDINGKLITFEKVIDVNVLLSEDGIDNSIAQLYCIKDDNDIPLLEKSAEDIEEHKIKLTKTGIKRCITKIKNISGLDLDVKLVPHDEYFSDENQTQKAKLETYQDENGDWKTRILISDKFGTKTDVIHEYLHVFLTGLKYQYPEIYYNLLQSVLGESSEGFSSIEDEEKFVEIVSKVISEGDLNMFKDTKNFIKGMITAVSLIVNDSDDQDQVDNFIQLIQDIDIENANTMDKLLNSSLVELFNINASQYTHDMYNSGMLMTEPILRQWMEKEGYKLKCI